MIARRRATGTGAANPEAYGHPMDILWKSFGNPMEQHRDNAGASGSQRTSITLSGSVRVQARPASRRLSPHGDVRTGTGHYRIPPKAARNYGSAPVRATEYLPPRRHKPVSSLGRLRARTCVPGARQISSRWVAGSH